MKSEQSSNSVSERRVLPAPLVLGLGGVVSTWGLALRGVPTGALALSAVLVISLSWDERHRQKRNLMISLLILVLGAAGTVLWHRAWSAV